MSLHKGPTELPIKLEERGWVSSEGQNIMSADLPIPKISGKKGGGGCAV